MGKLDLGLAASEAFFCSSSKPNNALGKKSM
jgi:hypothetical protein